MSANLDITASFPDDNVSNQEKDSIEFGTKVGEAIGSQWFDNQYLSYRRWWIDEMRSYARGEQSTAKYKNLIEGIKDEAATQGVKIKTHKIDYTEQLKVLPSFKDIVINAINEEDFKPRAEATDRTSVNNKRNYFKNLDVQFFSQDFAEAVGGQIGLDLKGEVPQDSQELETRKLEYKPEIEEAQEVAIDAWFRYNKFERIKDKIDEDLFDLGFGIGRHQTSPDEGIIMTYVDAYDYIHSTFEYDDGRDVRYAGNYDKEMIGKVLKVFEGSDENIDEMKVELKKASGATSTDHDDWIDGEDNNRLVEVIHFNYFTYRDRVFKKLRKNKSVKAIDRSDDGYQPENPNKKIVIPYLTWYTGTYVPAIRKCIKWEELENQVVDGANKPINEYVMFAPKVKRLSEKGNIRFDSMVQRAKPIVDDIHRDWYKLMQLKMELRPSTVEIDTQAIKDVMLNGQLVEAQTVLDLFFGRSVLLKRQFNEEGDAIPQAITERSGGATNPAVAILAAELVNNYNRLRSLLGINELRDGTTKPNDRTAVGVQKLLLASSNNATNHLVKASFSISLQFAEGVSYRLKDVLKSPTLRAMTEDMIGTKNVEIMSAIKDIPMHRFSIYHDFVPDSEERLAFEQSLIQAFNNKEIDVGVYNRARLVRNTKSAVKYLEYHVERRKREDEARQHRLLKTQSAANAEGSVAIQREQQRTIQMKDASEKSFYAFKAKVDRGESKIAALLKDVQDRKEHIRALELVREKAGGEINKETFRQDRMDDRENLKTENQAQLIDKRKTGKEVVTQGNDGLGAQQIEDIFNSSTVPEFEPLEEIASAGQTEEPLEEENVQQINQ